MRTNIVLDDELIAEATHLVGISTRREMVDRALREYVSRHRQREILGLAGQGLIDPSYDLRAVRAGMDRNSG